MFKVFPSVAIASLVAAAIAYPVPALSQNRYFGDFINEIEGLTYQLQESAEREQMMRAFSGDCLVFAVTFPDGTSHFVDSASVDRDGHSIYFAEVHIVNDHSFIRNYKSGNCASGEMEQTAAEGWNAFVGFVMSGFPIPNAYYPPNSYGRQILDTACNL